MSEQMFIKLQTLVGALLVTIVCPYLAFAQVKNRAVELQPYFGPLESSPLMVTEVKINNKSVKFNKPFAAGDDWVKELVIKVKNTSNEPIISVLMPVTILQEDDRPLGVGFVFTPMGVDINSSLLMKRKSLMPGEEVVLRFAKEQHPNTSAFRLDIDDPRIQKIRIGAVRVKFKNDMIKTISPRSLSRT